MKLSIWSHYFKGLSSEEKVKAFAECGYQYLELSTEDGDELLKRGDPEKVGKDFKNFAADYGISFLQGHLDLTADIRNRACVEALKIWLDLFNAIGIKACVLHYGRGRDLSIHPDRLLQSRVDSIGELTRKIEGTDMYICLENMSSKYDCTCNGL
jgi:sugar phosphate isomerase/epimerase